MEEHVGSGCTRAEDLHQSAGLRLGFRRGGSAELDHEPASTFGKESKAFRVNAFGTGVTNEEIVEAFEADGLVRHDFGNVVGALINVRVSKDKQHAFGRTFDQPARGFENGDARAFGTDQRARNVEAILGQKNSLGCSRIRGAECVGKRWRTRSP